MTEYLENPKTKGSGILACVPQKGICPMKCEDCFFQSGRSYLEPLSDNLPNIPVNIKGRIIRMNDGNDSNNQRRLVEGVVSRFGDYFFNTSIPRDIGKFSGPVVLTVNPSKYTDLSFHKIAPPPNLMFVRVRTNTWNIETVVVPAIDFYSNEGVPIVLTFMAYYNASIPKDHKDNYVFRKRTLNSYWAITTDAWEGVMERFKYNYLVHSCGKIEGERGNTLCRHCGNCLREYFATKERMRQ